LDFSYWTDKPWFLTEGKTCCYIHHTFLLGFPNWLVIHLIITAPSIAISGVSDNDDSTQKSEERSNLVINTQGGNPGNNHRKEKEKVYVSAGEWKTIISAVNHGIGIPADSRREVLMGY
jgi:hypothetical protein